MTFQPLKTGSIFNFLKCTIEIFHFTTVSDGCHSMYTHTNCNWVVNLNVVNDLFGRCGSTPTASLPRFFIFNEYLCFIVSVRNNHYDDWNFNTCLNSIHRCRNNRCREADRNARLADRMALARAPTIHDLRRKQSIDCCCWCL